MPVSPKTIKELIETSLPGALVAVDDPMNDGNHLQATVVSELFEGKSLLAQHKMVYEPLKLALQADLHALQLKTYSKTQWEKSKSNS
jgi:acid stress-induced BolA-like protein IbaG/YrbA